MFSVLRDALLYWKSLPATFVGHGAGTDFQQVIRMTQTTPAAADDAPIQNFSNCHVGILSHLKTFGELPALLEPAERARKIAADTLAFFRDAVLEHHSEEERDLFPAVIASSVKGPERDRVRVMVDQLTAEHRVVEAAFRKMEPELKKVAKGQTSELNGEAVDHLVRKYMAHAAFEEAEFLPLAHTILGRNGNHMAALGLTLHMRHTPNFVGHV